MNRLVTLVSVGVLGLAAASMASASVEIENFNSPGAQQSDPTQPFFLDAKYAGWGAPSTTLTANPDRFTISSTGYGSGYKYLGPVIDAGSNDYLQATFTVDQGVAGCLVDLSDEAGNGQAYRFYGLTPGNGTNGTNTYTFTVPFSSGAYFSGTGVLNTHDIVNMNIEIDPGGPTVSYTASFDDVSAVSVPEPASISVVALGGLFSLRRRRR
jgi:hypothetical protein